MLGQQITLSSHDNRQYQRKIANLAKAYQPQVFSQGEQNMPALLLCTLLIRACSVCHTTITTNTTLVRCNDDDLALPLIENG